MGLEDIVKFETGWGKGILGFILKKFLEGKFGVKFEDFTIREFHISAPADERNLKFDIAVRGEVDKANIISLL